MQNSNTHYNHGQLARLFTAILFCYLSSACKEKSYKEPRFGHVSFAIGLIKDSRTAECKNIAPTSARFPSHDGTIWIERSAKEWCEYDGTDLVSYWTNVTGENAQRVLFIDGGRASLGYARPILQSIEPIKDGQCGSLQYLSLMRKVVPSFGQLRVCEQTTAGDKIISYELFGTRYGYLPVLEI